MEITQVVVIAVLGTILAMMIRPQKPEIALQLTVVLGILIFLGVVDKLYSVVQALSLLAYKAGIDQTHFGIVLRAIAIAFIAEFGSQICKDAGEGAIAKKVEMAGKILIMVLAVPIILAIFETVFTLIP